MSPENGNMYQYEPLTHPRQIRVLYLTTPSSADEPLSGHLRVEQLGAATVSHEALSYEWGSPDKNHTFHIIRDGDSNGDSQSQALRITESLHNALLDLRGHQPQGPHPMPAAPRVIWADGICINQDDVSERGQQVALMGEIYRTASRVVTYIGPESEGSDVAIEFARRISENFTDQGTGPLNLPQLSDPGWAALRSLLLRTWVSADLLILHLITLYASVTFAHVC